MDNKRWFASMHHAQSRGFALKRVTFQCIRNGDMQGMAAMCAPSKLLAVVFH